MSFHPSEYYYNTVMTHQQVVFQFLLTRSPCIHDLLLTCFVGNTKLMVLCTISQESYYNLVWLHSQKTKCWMDVKFLHILRFWHFPHRLEMEIPLIFWGGLFPDRLKILIMKLCILKVENTHQCFYAESPTHVIYGGRSTLIQWFLCQSVYRKKCVFGLEIDYL